MVESKRVLVTLGEKDGMRAPVVKVWDLERVYKKVGMETPVLLRSEGADWESTAYCMLF
jgi:hypothetical protein